MDIIQTAFKILVGVITSFLLFLGSLIPNLVSQEIPNVPLPPQQVATTTGTFPTAQAKPIVKPAAKPATSATPAAPVTTPTPAPVPTKSQEVINDETRAALVNILCTPQTGINGISGSGVVIDSRGVILTNAHVGQYFLLRDYLTPGNITCTVRIG